jgi:hypothetical protein
LETLSFSSFGESGLSGLTFGVSVVAEAELLLSLPLNETLGLGFGTGGTAGGGYFFLDFGAKPMTFV